MEQQSSLRIRPAGRHILTIGRDLIQDQYAAIVELVKNSYDADASSVTLQFSIAANRKSMTIVVEDNGHGMSRETVVSKWLVPSTDDKIKRKTSPGGRVMQGRKGIGRYAVATLGDDLLLETITADGEKTELYVEWKKFADAEYLDQVEILVDTHPTKDPAGTRLTITGDAENVLEWDKRQFSKLQYELKKLVPPINADLLESNDDEFAIYLSVEDRSVGRNGKEYEKIEPYPIFQLYDYKIAGNIGTDGKGKLTFTNQRARNTPEEVIDINLGDTNCGELVLDLRIYDRERDSIEQLIRRGLRDEKGDYVGKLEARRILDQYNGVGVYRNGFRIRPLGDPDFDWLRLNELRIQNPSMRISSNQVIGYVLIQSEELSGLEEKSARDGLKENQAYSKLKDITHSVITELEQRRFQYRSKAGLSRNVLKVERDLERLFAFDDVKQGIRRRLAARGVASHVADEIIEILGQKEAENNRIADDLRQAVAIYQGQATLGKIINVILHEGRRPLNYFRNQVPNFVFWAKELREKYDPQVLEEVVKITEGMGLNAKLFANLFSRLDPLAAGKRGNKKVYNLHKVLDGAFRVFENEFIENKISYKIYCSEDITLLGWQEDMYVIMTNLIDNSIYWMVEKSSINRTIMVNIASGTSGFEYIDYRDSGPGIEPDLIESGVIFEPEFTTKREGSGLGLAIAGEAATRNALDLFALQIDNGVLFRLQPRNEVEGE